MQLKGLLFLLIFTAYLATPPVVNYFKANGEISMATIDEEPSGCDDNSETQKKIEIFNKMNTFTNNFDHSGLFVALFLKSSLNSSIYLDPVSPPPRLT
ncbi:hypothetical protein [Gramella sp. AN32]|uniref:Uncharacterized protein n=1 Tax=Christiangramia antarctica TaxID=2058158 RepID=A0ABW5X1H7_9FLAO|nr:hypothetical protein [Gramella sp. AN32]MCM4154887.1 hypothetical protein [Gramella sp. AN32]